MGNGDEERREIPRSAVKNPAVGDSYPQFNPVPTPFVCFSQCELHLSLLQRPVALIYTVGTGLVSRSDE